MNTRNLYIANLKVIFTIRNGKNIDDTLAVRHDGKYVLIRDSKRGKKSYQNIVIHKKYHGKMYDYEQSLEIDEVLFRMRCAAGIRYSVSHEDYIDLSSVRSFNDVVGNKEAILSKRKVLQLYKNWLNDKQK